MRIFQKQLLRNRATFVLTKTDN